MRLTTDLRTRLDPRENQNPLKNEANRELSVDRVFRCAVGPGLFVVDGATVGRRRARIAGGTASTACERPQGGTLPVE